MFSAVTQLQLPWLAPMILLLNVRVAITNNLCGHNKIFWKAEDSRNSTCLPCPQCPQGTEPSILCGSTVAHGTPLHCVRCRSGTYSDKFDTSPCAICTDCTDGNGRERLLRACTRTANAVCEGCPAGHFKNFVFNCVPCPRCCNNTPYESGCETAECQARQSCTFENGIKRVLGSTTPTVTEKSSTPDAVSPTPMARPTKQRKPHKRPDSTQRPSAVTTGNSARSTIRREKLASPRLTSIARSTLKARVYNDSGGATENALVKYYKDTLRVCLVMLFELIGLIVVLVIGVTVVEFRRKRYSSIKLMKKADEVENGPGGTEDARTRETIAFVNKKKVLTAVATPETSEEIRDTCDKVNSMKLSDFADQYPSTFDKVCRALDIKRGCAHYEHVAKDFGFEHDTIKSKFEGRRDESPSALMFESLRAEKPELTVREFLKVLKSENIRRNDVAEHFRLSKC